mmetsp:Transcript_18587/g.28927  ORF Transcript_18587/g.28927 Transcript_18587/m.28927 type:complete len:132 (-) Transcript_18587:3910-4305(-)
MKTLSNLKKFTISTSKFSTNVLLKRKQFIVDVFHPNVSSISKSELQHKIAEMYKIEDPSLIFLFGFKTFFGGNISKGFALVYTDLKSAREVEPRYKLIRNKLLESKKISGKQRKELKNRMKKKRGHEKLKK